MWSEVTKSWLRNTRELQCTTYQRTFLTQLLKKTFEPAIEDPTIKENLCFIDKAINIFLDYWSNQMEKLIAAVKIFLLTWLR